MATEKATEALDVVQEDDLVLLRLAATPLGHERDVRYEDLAEVYGDERLFAIASNLRSRRMLAWGSAWHHCWLTEDGATALEAVSEKAA